MSTTLTIAPESSTELKPLEPPKARDDEHLSIHEEPNLELRSGELSKRRAIVLVFTVAGVNFLDTLGTGILTVALPTMGRDVGLGVELLLWPASIYALTSGCTLLLAGSLADILGRRKTFLTGTFLYAAFQLGVALSKTGASLIVFRGLQGVSISLCLTTAVGIVSTSFPGNGNRRNLAFAATGAAQPVGYTVGLVLGGVFVGAASWRAAFYFATGLNVLILITAVFGLPDDEEMISEGRRSIWNKMRVEIDWIGAAIATVSISLLSYVMAVVTGSASNIKEVQNIVLLSLALSLMVAFPLWMRRQEKLQRPAIIPNSVWSESAFTTTCIVVFLSWGAFNAFIYFATLFFQEVQLLSPLQTSLRLLPTVVCGILANIATGFLVRIASANYLVGISSVLSAVSCLLMALVNPAWSFWKASFIAVFLIPTSSDVLYTISSLIITATYPSSKQSLAGGVFNTVSQIGNSVGLTVGAVIAASVSASSKDPKSPEGLEKGFRATFWACFSALALVAIISLLGLRKAGKVGIKSD